MTDPTHLVAYYGIHAQRGREAMDDLGVLTAFTAALVTDALTFYTFYGNAQALCGAHVLRELIAVTEDIRRDPAWGPVNDGREPKDAVAHAVVGGYDALPVDALVASKPATTSGVVRHRRPAPIPAPDPQRRSLRTACGCTSATCPATARW